MRIFQITAAAALHRDPTPEEQQAFDEVTTPTQAELDREKAAARDLVNVDAEVERARVATSQPLQQREYGDTEREAAALKRYLAENPGGPAPVSDDYPNLQAEVDARADAGETITLEEAADSVIAALRAIEIPYARIRRLRRSGELRIEKATSFEEVAAVLDSLDWSAVLAARR